MFCTFSATTGCKGGSLFPVLMTKVSAINKSHTKTIGCTLSLGLLSLSIKYP